MSEPTFAGPRHDPWTVAVYAAVDSHFPLGAGVVIDERRILTCKHVVEGKYSASAPLFVAFPKAGVRRTDRRQVSRVRKVREADVAVLELAEPVPPEATPAPLRSPRPADLVGGRWWAFGFPRDAEFGTDAHGVVGASLAYGWVRLDTRSRYVVKQGFSGAGLWSNDFRAVVGLVGQAQRGGDHHGDALAVTLHQAVKDLPDENLAALSAWSLSVVGESALEAWGWSLDTDAEAVRHWRPRARGVSIDSEGGYRFRGRTAALAQIVGWLQRPVPDRRVLVLTGSPGVGKSAVLGRVVTTADPGVRAALPPDDRNVRAPVGSIACAVHTKGKTALDVAAEIARAASVRVPHAAEDLPPALRRALEQRPGRTFNLVIDALDEATSPTQARLMISALLVPIAQTCARFGAQVVVGTRRVDDGGNLLNAFGTGTRTIDLDLEEFFAEEDLADYALATLTLIGDERPGNPYADVKAAVPVARRIAALADRNFLIAGLIARAHGLYDAQPVNPQTLAFTPTVDAALAEYMRRLPPVNRVPAAMVLTALAYAQTPGLSVELWRVALASLGARIVEDELAGFVGSSAANFLVESSSEAGMRRYRLFHQALNDALLRERDGRGRREFDESALARDLIAHGRNVGWAAADPYLLRSLPIYADRAKVIDELLTDDSYLLHADLPRLTQLAEHATTEAGRARTRLLHLTPHAIAAPPAERAALFGVTAELEQLGTAFADWQGVPYRARWASVTRRVERAVLEGHAGAVRATCPITADGQTLLATAGDYRSVRLWDPVTGRYQSMPARHTGQVFAVCAVAMEGLVLLATAGQDSTIQLWDPSTGRHLGTLNGHTGPIRALCTVDVGGRTLLASAGDDRTVRLWDLATGRQRVLSGHVDTVSALCTVPLGKRLLLASAGHDYTARLWDPVGGRLVRTLHGHIDWVRAVCPVTTRNGVLLATANFKTVRLWDLVTGAESHTLDGHTEAIRAMSPITLDGRELLATAGDDSAVRIWDPINATCRRILTGHAGAVSAVCPVVVDGRMLLATASHDRTVRLWDLSASQRVQTPSGRANRVSAACSVSVDERQLVATVDNDNGVIRLQDADTGVEISTMKGHAGGVNSICAVTIGFRDLIAAASSDDIVQLWDPATGHRLPRVIRQFGQLRTVCAAATNDGQTLLASAGHNRKVIQLWEPATCRNVRTGLFTGLLGSVEMRRVHAKGANAIHQFVVNATVLLATASDDQTVMLWTMTGHHIGALKGHRGPVRALCSVLVDGRTLLVTASADQTIRTWDPATGQCVNTLTGHTDGVNAICPVTVYGQPMLASGSQDRTVRVWDLANRSPFLSIPVHHPALACIEVSGLLFVGLTAGSLAVDINPSRNDLAYFRKIRSS